eukprot:231473-Ditylum_brightwellii.AAC.1
MIEEPDQEPDSLCNTSVVRLSITTSRFIVTIQVNGSICTLVEPDIPPLCEIRNKSFRSPSDLLLELSRAGLHLLPTDEDIQRVNHTVKIRDIEERMVSDLSYLCPSYFVKSSRFSVDLGRTKATYQIKESDAFTGAGCDPFLPYLAMVELDRESASAKCAPGSEELPVSCGSTRCSILVEGQEEDGAMSAELLDLSAKEGTQSCLYMMNCIQPISTEEAIQKVKESSPRTTETMKQLLQLTRPFSLC